MKVFLDSIGCRLNQSEIEKFAQQFRAAGHTLVASAAEADLVVVNTCTVTAKAASDSRQRVRQAARQTQGKIIITGCWATLEPEAALALPKVERVVANPEKDGLVASALGRPLELFDLEPLAREPLPGIHRRTRAFLKVQDGCDNHCTFCITRIARGKSRSRSIAEVLSDVRAAQAGGAQEIVLTGVQLGAWGQDFASPLRLHDLVKTILAESDVARLRLSSLEPWDLDERFFSLWADERLCRHLHLPLQSGSAATLRRMARKTTPRAFRALVEQARSAAPEMAITTDLIVGFPGEDESEFQESLEYVKSVQFAGGHVFSYSPRPGTPAERLPGQVAPGVIRQRNAQMRAVFEEEARRYASAFIGREVQVLWESAAQVGDGEWELHGLTDTYLHICARSDRALWNQFSRVKVEALEGDELTGRVVG